MNIHGFGGLTKQKALRTLFSTLKPDMILLQETMCDHVSAFSLFAKLRSGWESCALDAHGISGGLLTGWNPHLTRCKAYHSFVGILIKARFKGLDFVYYILNCYGPYSNRAFF